MNLSEHPVVLEITCQNSVCGDDDVVVDDMLTRLWSSGSVEFAPFELTGVDMSTRLGMLAKLQF